jgi:hypothetical protein
VRAWLDGTKVGWAGFKPYGVADNFEMLYADIWASNKTEVCKGQRRRGIAQAMYGHLKAFGFSVAPAPVLLDEGRDLWIHGLDPNIAITDFPPFGNRPVRTPMLPLPPVTSDAQLSVIMARFDVERTMYNQLFSGKEDRKALISNLSGDVFKQAREALQPWYVDVDEALGRILSDSTNVDGIIAALSASPSEYGQLKADGRKRLFAKFRKEPRPSDADVRGPISAAISAFTVMARQDDARLKCTYEADCVYWIGRTINVPREE